MDCDIECLTSAVTLYDIDCLTSAVTLCVVDCLTPAVTLCAGNDLFLDSITPELVIINPPEKLVLEVEASGAYERFNWQRNGATFSFIQGAAFPISTDRYFNFFEVYVQQSTTSADLGLYEVALVQFGSQNNINAIDQRFMVVPYGEFVYY